ncbi:MAG: bifunctional diaminohydroxyphosphoribosylaminopyrimidine deaminase/5-amino-6-(5-phosphoribosylamino)uracil reductase RibD [Alphaproteobacteria bacterium]|nr:bifunctional diaminohydroxyphosphoribosylaminopyrimidine deaminase/5-amino-6-(5-phosphoribosylamino)uracil reductase RibD [Alphaproteobacteria bacterium]
MAAALGLARRGLGRVWPNPAVGCILVKDGAVVGRGWTQPGGRPHAETEALSRAGEGARGATAYVTLEPCAHHGKTPPCAEALIRAGISRAVVAAEDPDDRVSGRGIEMLRSAGIDVEIGVLEDEAKDLNAGFFSRVLNNRPLVTLKLATTLDGRIATHRGESKWITGERARSAGHMLRASHDAILVGVGTALADNPDLNCRLPGLDLASPVRIVADSRLRLPLTSKLVQSAKDIPTWLLTLENGPRERRHVFEKAGVRLIEVSPGEGGYPDLGEGLRKLADAGLTRVLAEGGAHLSAALLRADLIDRLVWFHALGIMGGDGVPAASAFGVDALAQMPRFARLGARALGNDMEQVLERVRET